MKLTDEQLDTLRHMLGINTPLARVPEPTRDYYCANAGDAHMVELERLGAVRKYMEHGGYEYFRTTEAGRSAGMASHRSIRKPKAARVYARFLSVSDCFPDLTFGRFLKDVVYADLRREA